MLRVLAIVPCPTVFGLQIMTLRFFERLSGKIKSHFLVTRWTDGQFARRLDQLAIPYTYSWLGMFSRKLDRRNLEMTISCIARLPRLYWDFVRLVQTYRPDVIYVGNYHELILLFPVLLPLRLPVVYHVHNLLPSAPFYQWSFSFWKRAVNHYIAVSESVKDSILSLGVDPKKISLLYNGIDLSHFEYAEKRTNYFCNKYGWPHESVIVGMTGQMNEIKGHVDLLAAARVVYQKDSRIRFVIGGKQDQSYFRLLQEQVAENDLTEIAAFSGWQDDMTGFYRGLDIFVFPSRCDEAFGLVSAEAMATGLPVISTRSGGASEVVENGKTGILVERQCPDQLSDAIASLVSSSAKRKMMGIEGRRRVETFFELSKQSSQLQTVLENVANSPDKKPYLFV